VLCAPSKEEAGRVLSQLKIVIRTNYSNPPIHGGAVVAAVLNNPELRALWEEGTGRDARAHQGHAPEAGRWPEGRRREAGHELHHRQIGMFSYSGLTKDQMVRLRSEFGVYGTDTGRMCVAALNSKNIDYVCQAIAKVQALLRTAPFQAFFGRPGHADQAQNQPVVLIVAPLSGHYATLLRDTVRTMLKDHKVYITDWKNARLVPLSEGEFPPGRLRQLRAGVHPPPAGHLRQLPRDQRVPAHGAGAGCRVADGQPRRTTPAHHDHDGRPDRRAQVAHRGEQPGHEPQLRVVREQRDLPRAEQLPGRRPPRVPGFLQHTGFVAMNPDRHATSHYDYFKDLIKGDDASAEAHRKFYDEYNAVLDMDADYYLETIKTVFQDFNLVMAPGMCAPRRQDGARAPAGHHHHRAVHGGRRTGRHLRLRPDRGRTRPVHRHRAQRAAPPGSQGRRPLRHLQWPPLARRKARDATAHAEKLEKKAEMKLADLAAHSQHTDPLILDKKRLVIEAALARARAKRAGGD
jgi:hypothetical protein